MNKFRALAAVMAVALSLSLVAPASADLKIITRGGCTNGVAETGVWPSGGRYGKTLSNPACSWYYFLGTFTENGVPVVRGPGWSTTLPYVISPDAIAVDAEHGLCAAGGPCASSFPLVQTSS
jgi:hypothetical protein